MKSAIAAFVAARFAADRPAGTLSLLITGDEEGYATYGTPRIIDWLNERDIRPDMILIGEPTSVDRLGDTVKIGRRGSVNMWIDVPGVQGHVAYPHRATNPIAPSPASSPRSTRCTSTTATSSSRRRTSNSPPSHADRTPATSSPARRRAQLNIRFNNLQHGADLVEWSRRSPSARRPARRSARGFRARPF